MILVLTIAHVAIAAAWFGHKLLLPGDIRTSVHAGQVEAEDFVSRLRRAQRFGILTGLGTLVSGAGLMWAVGVETVSYWIWIGLALVVGALAVGVLVARPASKRLAAAMVQGDRVAATVEGRQIGRALAAESVLWLGALATMLV